jgi:Dna[CI] antecedent, DciA
LTQNKDFRTDSRTFSPCQSKARFAVAMQNSKSLSELLARGGKRLSLLKARSAERSKVLEQVRAALPARLGQAVASAGITEGRLTIGVVGAVWASRLRYSTEIIRKRVAKSAGLDILTVRIRVVPPAD